MPAFLNRLSCSLALLWLTLTCATALAAQGDYPQTIQALQERYADEIEAHQTYGAYARHALQDGYPNIAHLFRALAASEAIHARNFAKLLEQLGAPPHAAAFQAELTSTQAHLEQATGIAAAEIDVQDPAIIPRPQPDGHHAARENQKQGKDGNDTFFKCKIRKVHLFQILL